jgi:hypothetical protein
MNQTDGRVGPAIATQSTEGSEPRARPSGALGGKARVAWAVVTLVVVQSIVCGLAVLPDDLG